jgi:serine/threonine protein kinase
MLRVLDMLGATSCGPGLVATKSLSLTRPDGSVCTAVGFELGVRGTTLRNYLRELPTIRGRLRVVVPLLECFSRLHAVSILHGDVKPSNVIARELPGGLVDIRLIDFELSVLLDLPASTTRAHLGCGTQFYLAPEVDRRVPYGLPADVYSLGVSLLHAVFRGALPTLDVYFSIFISDSSELSALRHQSDLRYLNDEELAHLVDTARQAAVAEGLGALIDVIVPMVSPDPRARPTVGAVLEAVRPLVGAVA